MSRLAWERVVGSDGGLRSCYLPNDHSIGKPSDSKQDTASFAIKLLLVFASNIKILGTY